MGILHSEFHTPYSKLRSKSLTPLAPLEIIRIADKVTNRMGNSQGEAFLTGLGVSLNPFVFQYKSLKPLTPLEITRIADFSCKFIAKRLL